MRKKNTSRQRYSSNFDIKKVKYLNILMPRVIDDHPAIGKHKVHHVISGKTNSSWRTFKNEIRWKKYSTWGGKCIALTEKGRDHMQDMDALNEELDQNTY